MEEWSGWCLHTKNAYRLDAGYKLFLQRFKESRENCSSLKTVIKAF